MARNKEQKRISNALEKKKRDSERAGILADEKARARLLRFLWIPANTRMMFP